MLQQLWSTVVVEVLKCPQKQHRSVAGVSDSVHRSVAGVLDSVHRSVVCVLTALNRSGVGVSTESVQR